MMASVLIQVLGGFRLTVAGRVGSSLPRKAQALLAYLAVQDGRPATRDTVSDLLWTDRGAEQARHSLRQTLLVLRRELPDVIGGDARTLALRPDLVETDIGPFQRLARSRERSDLAEAGELFRGALLADFPAVARDFDDWLEGVRRETTALAIEAQERLCDVCLAAGDIYPAITAAERTVQLDPLREDSHRRLIRTYLHGGRRSDARRQYQVCVEMLRQDLEVEPSAETAALLREITDAPTISTMNLLPKPSNGAPRLAVLPFSQWGAAAVPEYVVSGLVEDIIRQLTGLREASVISHGTTSLIEDAGQSLERIGRRLDARYVVRGNIRRSGETVRISTELSDTTNSQVIWTRSYDTHSAMSFDEQDRIVAQIVNTIAPHIMEAELQRIKGQRIEELSIYEKTLLARSLLVKLGGENFQQAKTIMDEVIEHQPNWGEAYALAADCHGLLLAEGWSGSRDYHIGEIHRLSREALALDRDNVRALTFYGHRKTIFHRDHEAAREMFRRALEVAPGSAESWLWSAYTYAYMGDGHDAIRRATRALELSPFDRKSYWFYIGLCIAHYSAEEYDSAVSWGQRALAEPAVGRTGRIWVAAALAGAGRLREAREMGRWMRGHWPDRGVADIVAQSPYRDPGMRLRHGRHLALAELPN